MTSPTFYNRRTDTASTFSGCAGFKTAPAYYRNGPVSFIFSGAIFSVHIHNGLFMSNNGYEYALALFAVAVSLVVSGGGRISVDSLIVKK